MMPRSFLLTPIACQRSIDAALSSEADVIMLDLVGLTPEIDRAEARALLPERVRQLTALGRNVVVRINGGALAPLDIRAAAIRGVCALIMTKIEHAARITDLHALLSAAEEANGLERGSIRTTAVIDHPHTVLEAREIACSSTRMMALGFGVWELAAAMGMRPEFEALAMAAQMVALAARGAGLQCVGAIGMLPEAQTPEGLAAAADRSRSIGFNGAVVVDSAQVSTINAVFSPAAEDIERAREIVLAFEARTTAHEQVRAVVGGGVVERPAYWQARAALGPLGEKPCDIA
jgi:citrate lyase subunit beta/citryl-CoA lyase